MSRISHREASKLDRKDALEGKGGNLGLEFLFGFGNEESWAKKKVRWLLLGFSDLADFHPYI